MTELENYILLFYWIQNKVIKTSFLDSSCGLHWLEQFSERVSQVFFGILLCLGKSIVKNQAFVLEFWP